MLTSTACGIGLDAKRGQDDTGSPDTADEVHIVSITPNYGPTGGGTQVVINAEGLQGDIEVFFGNAKVPNTVDGNMISVTSPNAGAPFAIDITVRSDLGEDVVPGGFAFSDTGIPPDTGDTGVDTGTPPTGLVGGLIEFTRTQYACPSCLNLSSEFEVRAAAVFHPPVNGTWDNSLPPQGQCAIDPAPNGLSGAFIDAGDWAYLRSGSTNISMFRTSGTSGPTYKAENLPVNDYISNGSYDLEVPGGGSTGAFSITGAVRAADGFNSVTPFEMLYGGPDGAFVAQVNGSGQTFTWQPAGSGDGFLMVLGVYDYYDGTLLGTIYCHGPDSGSMFVPFANYVTPPVLLTVGFYRRNITRTTNPTNGSIIEAISMAGFSSTATMAF